MKYLNKLIPWVAAAAIFTLLEMILVSPKRFYYSAGLIILIVAYGVWQLSGQKITSFKYWRFFITPLILIGSGLNFFLYLEGSLTVHFFVLVMTVLIWLYLEVIYLRLYFRPKYEPYSLENITVYVDLLSIFLLASSLYSTIIFLDINIWLLIGLFAIICFLASAQLIWASGITMIFGWRHLAVIVLSVTEVFYVVSFLPTSVYVNGFLVAICYYLISGLIRNWLLDIRENRVIKRYLVVSILCIVIILLTAKWV